MQLNQTLAAGTADRYEQLRAALRECGRLCVGYSGGVDSVFLAKVAVDTLGTDRVLAVTGLSPAVPEVQRRTARECAARYGIPHVEIDTAELDDPSYAQNPANRCYFCKSELWPKVMSVARARGFDIVADGANADDAGDYRPGRAAAREHGVRSPLADAGLTKREIRELSNMLGLPTWDQPSAPCLASRLPYGIAVTPARLHQVEAAESALRSRGYIEFRVRHHDDAARIEFAPAELARAIDDVTGVNACVSGAGFARVLIDVEGYRSGALNEALVQLGGARAEGVSVRADAAPLPAHGVAGFHRDIAVLALACVAEARRHAGAFRRAGYRYIAVDAGGAEQEAGAA